MGDTHGTLPSWRCDDETRHLRADAKVRRHSHDTGAAGYPGASGSSTAANGAVSSSAAAASGGTVDGFFWAFWGQAYRSVLQQHIRRINQYTS